VLLWCCGVVVLWCCGVVLLCFCAFVLLCFCAFVLLCFCAFVLLCFCAFVLLCFCAFVLLCFCAFLLIDMSFLFLVVSLQWFSCSTVGEWNDAHKLTTQRAVFKAWAVAISLSKEGGTAEGNSEAADNALNVCFIHVHYSCIVQFLCLMYVPKPVCSDTCLFFFLFPVGLVGWVEIDSARCCLDLFGRRWNGRCHYRLWYVGGYFFLFIVHGDHSNRVKHVGAVGHVCFGVQEITNGAVHVVQHAVRWGGHEQCGVFGHVFVVLDCSRFGMEFCRGNHVRDVCGGAHGGVWKLYRELCQRSHVAGDVVFSFGGGFGTFVSTCLGTGRVKCCGWLLRGGHQYIVGLVCTPGTVGGLAGTYLFILIYRYKI
jgi:hypothetical protein